MLLRTQGAMNRALSNLIFEIELKLSRQRRDMHRLGNHFSCQMRGE